MQYKNHYRIDIDGLRAVAVLLVVLFHAGLGFSGGFIGVDVFFVISGYLITGIIVRETESDYGFSLKKFWQRRIHRILPAVLVMVVCVLLIAPFLMISKDLIALAKSAIAQSLMMSNFRFARMPSGYFSTTTELWPLLHTWSLAVEEQFYIFYPVALSLVVKKFRRYTAACIWTLILISFLGSIFLTPSSPSFSFYLLPTRAWELGLGAALAIHPPMRFSLVVSHLASLLGLALIVGASLVIDSSTPFPGSAAGIPCLGAALIIGVQSRGENCRRWWLENRLLVGIGLLSYSIYLWHWPIFSFLRYCFGIHLPLELALMGVVLTGVLSVASYLWIEKPFRNLGRQVSFYRSCLGALIASMLVLGLAAFVLVTNGVDIGPRQTAAEKVHVENRPSMVDGFKVGEDREEVDFVVMGDSHATSAWNFFDAAAKDSGLSGYIFGKHSTLPLPGVWWPYDDDGLRMAQWVSKTLEEIKTLQPKHLILVARWTPNVTIVDDHRTLLADQWLSDTTPEMAQEAMRLGFARISQFAKEEGIELLVLGQPPRQPEGIERRIFQQFLYVSDTNQINGIERSEYEKQHEVVNEILESLPSHVAVIMPSDFSASTVVVTSGVMLYRDDDHLTTEGVRFYFGNKLHRVFTGETSPVE